MLGSAHPYTPRRSGAVPHLDVAHCPSWLGTPRVGHLANYIHYSPGREVAKPCRGAYVLQRLCVGWRRVLERVT